MTSSQRGTFIQLVIVKVAYAPKVHLNIFITICDDSGYSNLSVYHLRMMGYYTPDIDGVPKNEELLALFQS